MSTNISKESPTKDKRKKPETRKRKTLVWFFQSSRNYSCMSSPTNETSISFSNLFRESCDIIWVLAAFMPSKAAPGLLSSSRGRSGTFPPWELLGHLSTWPRDSLTRQWRLVIFRFFSCCTDIFCS